MSSNRVQYFIRSILQNTKLNREKFIKNKKIMNKTKIFSNKINWVDILKKIDNNNEKEIIIKKLKTHIKNNNNILLKDFIVSFEKNICYSWNIFIDYFFEKLGLYSFYEKTLIKKL